MNKQIKNIIFDWGGVLIDLNLEGCISAFEQAGAVNVRNLLTGTNELGFFRDYECGNISTPEFRAAIRKYISQPLTDEEIDRMWNMELLTVPEEKLHLLAELSKSYRLFLLSNTNELHWEYGSRQAFCRNGKDYKTYFERISSHIVCICQNLTLRYSKLPYKKQSFSRKKPCLLMMRKSIVRQLPQQVYR